MKALVHDLASRLQISRDLIDKVIVNSSDLSIEEEKILLEKGIIQIDELGMTSKSDAFECFIEQKFKVPGDLRFYLSLLPSHHEPDFWKEKEKLILQSGLMNHGYHVRISGASAEETCLHLGSVTNQPLLFLNIELLETTRYQAEFLKTLEKIQVLIEMWHGVLIYEIKDTLLAKIINQALPQLPIVMIGESDIGSYRIDLSSALRVGKGEFWGAEIDLLHVDTMTKLESLFKLDWMSTRRVMNEVRMITSKEPTYEMIANAARKYCARSIDHLTKRIQTRYGWDDIVVPKIIVDRLREIYDYIVLQSEVERDWRFRHRHTRGHGTTILFKGLSGTGKTMAAEVLAHELGLDLFQVDLANITSKYIGETQKNLSKIFQSAKECGGILFFDEGETLFSKRSNIESSQDKYANLEVNFLLQEIESFTGIVIISTNHSQMIDSAFLRRINFEVEFPRPIEATRHLIWFKYLQGGVKLDQDIDIDFLARLPLTGGLIYNIVKRAAASASRLPRSDRKLCMKDILHSVRREFQKNGLEIERDAFGPYWRFVSPEWEVALTNVQTKTRVGSTL